MPPVELLEEPSARVARLDVLHVEDARVDEGVVRLHGDAQAVSQESATTPTASYGYGSRRMSCSGS